MVTQTQQDHISIVMSVDTTLFNGTCMLFCVRAGRPVIALECRHVAMRLCKSVPKVDDVADAVLEILQREGAASAAFVCHSYGTAVGSRLVLRAPEAVHRLCLIDPVS